MGASFLTYSTTKLSVVRNSKALVAGPLIKEHFLRLPLRNEEKQD